MKKIFLFFFLLLSCSMEAQITRTINGITLGKSTRQDVIRFLQKNNTNYQTVEGGSAIAGYGLLYFGQTEWNKVCFRFYKNLVFQICYEKRGLASEGSTIVLEYAAIRQILMKKYSRYYHPFPGSTSFSDGKTNLHLGGGTPGTTQEMYIWYTDAALVKKHNNDLGF